MRALKKIDKLLHEKAMSISKRKGDDYNNFLFSQINPEHMTTAERRSCKVYLFGAMWDRATLEDLGRLP